MNYHVRVLVPCYREPLSIVSRTILGAHEAVLPNGCQRDIYVCDDGKDPKIRKFCRSLGPSVTYVSGRRREAGEMNGKSGNLNNCLQQIYPEGVPVPPTELVAIFDADQARLTFCLRSALHVCNAHPAACMLADAQGQQCLAELLLGVSL